MSSTYEKLVARIREIGQLESIESLLDWDQETHMPPNGLKSRAEQLALIAQLLHERRTSEEVGTYLADPDGSPGDPVETTNIREMRRVYERGVRVPAELMGRIARVSTMAKGAWGEARRNSKFSTFAPHLNELLNLKREMADLIGHDGDRYDPLLDGFEPGMKTSEVADIFSRLRQPLTRFAHEIAASPKQPDTSILHRHFPQPAQAQFARRLAESIGFDFQSGRMDISTHPFCSGTTPYDVRLTTRYNENHFSAAIFGTLHEAGHGVYEQGLDPNHMFTPMGSAVSLGIHESQSLLWENMIGRSSAFWEHAYPDCRAAFPDALGDVSLDAFVAAINAVHPSLIRVEADEVTYNLHIIVRFELERAMLDGSLAVDEIPEAWNVKMDELLGVAPPDDAQGCLQDIHWSMGTFGYFPTYALGKIYGAQFYAAARRAIPDLTDLIRKGDFLTLLDWLRANIYRHGQRYRANELLRIVAGESVTIEPFMKYVREKFSPIYGL